MPRSGDGQNGCAVLKTVGAEVLQQLRGGRQVGLAGIDVASGPRCLPAKIEKMPIFAPMSRNTSEGRKLLRNQAIVSGSLPRKVRAR